MKKGLRTGGRWNLFSTPPFRAQVMGAPGGPLREVWGES